MDQDNMTPNSDVDETTQNDAQVTTPSADAVEKGESEEENKVSPEETSSEATE